MGQAPRSGTRGSALEDRQRWAPRRSLLPKLGGGFKYILCSPLFGEDVQFDYSNIFSDGFGTQATTLIVRKVVHQNPGYLLFLGGLYHPVTVYRDYKKP